jgi:hypothetical protein
MADTWPSVAASKGRDPNAEAGITRKKSYAKRSTGSIDQAALTSRNRSASILKYPVNDKGYPASVTFQVKEIVPVDEKIMTSYITDAAAQKESETENSAKLSPFERERRISDAKPPTTQSTTAKGDVDLGATFKYSNPLKIIQMYFPLGVVINDNVSYENANLNPAGAAALTGVNSGKGIMSSIAAGVIEGGQSALDLIKTGAANDALKVLATRLASTFVPREGVGNAIKLGLQVTVNPNTRALFQGVTPRQFTFTFKMIPTSQTEAIQAEEIVKLFRKELYPDPIFAGPVPVGFKFPNLFEIKFKWRNGENQHLPQPLLCYLRDVQVNYTPTTTGWHDDGRVTEMDLTLQFQEYRTMNSEDVEAGH